MKLSLVENADTQIGRGPRIASIYCRLRNVIINLYVVLFASVVLFGTPYAAASEPRLAFSDLISGPDVGIGDGEGSGVIVTVWGFNLGVDADNGNVYFTDSKGKKREAAKVYYWRNADGELPSGPANLYESLKMQEIAFSIPDSAEGLGKISITVNNQTSNYLNFTVRDGNIYHIKSSGSDQAGDGSYNNPWATMAKALSVAPKGSTLYLHGISSGSSSSKRAIYWNNGSSSSGLDNQFAIIAYPGFRPSAMGQRAIENYNVEGMVVSKMDVFASNYTSVDSLGQPSGSPIDSKSTFGIRTSKNGRIVANRITDIPGGCSSKWDAAIVGNANNNLDRVSNVKILGNEIHDYGCHGTDKLHHTTYLSVRSGTGLIVDPWEFGYNYLHDNQAKFGIHQYDEGDQCGDVSAPIKIHNNVIINQSGSGISVGTGYDCGWSMDVYVENNILRDVGLAADWDGKDVDTSTHENGGIGIRDSGDPGLTGTIYVRNNIVWGYTTDGQSVGGSGCLNLNGGGDAVDIVWENNICVATVNRAYVGATLAAENKFDNISGANNIWFSDVGPGINLKVPAWDDFPINKDPLLEQLSSHFGLAAQSPAIDAGKDVGVETDVYGTPRDNNIDIGAIEYVNAAPKPPKNLDVD